MGQESWNFTDKYHPVSVADFRSHAVRRHDFSSCSGRELTTKAWVYI